MLYWEYPFKIVLFYLSLFLEMRELHNFRKIPDSGVPCFLWSLYGSEKFPFLHIKLIFSDSKIDTTIYLVLLCSILFDTQKNK